MVSSKILKNIKINLQSAINSKANSKEHKFLEYNSSNAILNINIQLPKVTDFFQDIVLI